MATRKRELGADAHGCYRPCVDWWQDYHTDDVGRVIRNGVRRQPRFNLGTDRKEAERRLARIKDLYEDNCKLMGSDLWSPQALAFAKEIARGERRITYPSFSEVIDQDDPLLEYAQMHHNIREMYPSVEFEADPALYAQSSQLNKRYVAENLKALENELRQEGALPPNGELPRELIPGTLHEAFYAYAEDVHSHNIEPATRQITSYGLRRLQRVERFKEHHGDTSLTALEFDSCKSMIEHWRNRPAG